VVNNSTNRYQDKTQQQEQSEDKLTSMLLGLDVDEEGEDDDVASGGVTKKGSGNGSDVDVNHVPYIDHLPPHANKTPVVDEKDQNEERRIAAESQRIIHLQVLREKVKCF
jgi:hypothetical protein